VPQTRFVQEFDLVFQPSSAFAVWSRLRQQTGISLHLAIWPGREEMYLLTWEWPANKSTDVSPRVGIPDLQTGRVIQIAAAVDVGRYTVFLDGRKVIEYQGDQFGSSSQAISIQALGCNGGLGAMRIVGARVYRLAEGVQ
jgi:hypothetical protein